MGSETTLHKSEVNPEPGDLLLDAIFSSVSYKKSKTVWWHGSAAILFQWRLEVLQQPKNIFFRKDSNTKRQLWHLRHSSELCLGTVSRWNFLLRILKSWTFSEIIFLRKMTKVPKIPRKHVFHSCLCFWNMRQSSSLQAQWDFYLKTTLMFSLWDYTARGFHTFF